MKTINLYPEINKPIPKDKKWNYPKDVCPPLGKGCPMMYRYIPSGESATCSECGKVCNSSLPVYL